MSEIDDAFESAGVKTDNSSKELMDSAKDAGMKVEVNKKEEAKQIVYNILPSDRDLAVNMYIVPEKYRNAYFDVDKIKANLREQYTKNGKLYKVYKFNDYVSVCTAILSNIRMHVLPTRSYLIGAPNGFGKTSFVNECLITLIKQNYKVAPYISLSELAQIRVDNEHRLMNPYKKYKEVNSDYTYTEMNIKAGYQKVPEVVTGRYSYSEYINADCLFVYFTDVVSKDIESHMLYQLLTIRGAKALPTIVMMSTSLEPYENDMILKEQVWDEIKDYSESSNSFDRVYHVSCYKHKNLALDNKDETVDNDTGVVNS